MKNSDFPAIGIASIAALIPFSHIRHKRTNCVVEIYDYDLSRHCLFYSLLCQDTCMYIHVCHLTNEWFNFLQFTYKDHSSGSRINYLFLCSGKSIQY